MRKTQRCSATKMEVTPRLRVRVCNRPRKHDGNHYDDHGSWSDEGDKQ